MWGVGEFKLHLCSSFHFLEAATWPVNVVPWAVPTSERAVPDVGCGRVQAAPVYFAAFVRGSNRALNGRPLHRLYI
jgi:hypothetical protein